MDGARKAGARVALVAILVMTVAGCRWIPVPGGGGGTPTSCPTGSWTIASESITKSLPAIIPGLTITTAGPGVTLALNDDNTWTLNADQTLTATMGSATATVHVTADANGTYTSTQQTIAFTLGSLSGSATYDITAFGSNFSGTVTLPASGLSKLYGLSQTANYSCSSDGLDLSFPSFAMHGTD